MSRLLELEGITYHFRHEQDRHTLILTDAPGQYEPFPGYETIPYHVTPTGGTTDEEGISQWALEDSVTPGIYSLDDYDFRKPNAWLFQARQNPKSPQPGSIDVYDWPGRFVEHGHGEFYARIRQERWQVEHRQTQGSGTALGIAPGHTFVLRNAPFFGDNGEYLTTVAHYHFEENRYASGADSNTIHETRFEVIPADVPYRPSQKTPWPRTYGPQTAKVVGPQGESIWTDKYGRVKVKFHWDRLSKGDDTSSGWVRVSSAWAGQGFGGVQIPRVGDEVVVDFINGDPDRPLITGRVYNEASMPPWELPGDATRMGFMTRSKDGHRDNASYLFFEDKMGDELLDMHAEKNMNISVENDKTVAIDGCRTTTIGRDQKDEVTGDASFYYKQKRTTVVDQRETRTFNNGEETTITNGKTLMVTSGGFKSEITDLKKDIIHGNRSTTIDTGDYLTINDGGQEQSIKGNVNVNIDGNWVQKITNGHIHISSPDKITIKSDTEVNVDSPYLSSNAHVHQETYSAIALSFTLFNSGVNLTNFGYSIAEYSNKKFDLTNSDVRTELISGAKIMMHGIMLHAAKLSTFL
ncbi:type VI secretion system tip protein VgrG [Cronobacter dublinensis subsp. dublinensis]|nr:type VI secretion system tip protein VgrG [Cronobacter dublinensis subsp. dublinensis]